MMVPPTFIAEYFLNSPSSSLQSQYSITSSRRFRRRCFSDSADTARSSSSRECSKPETAPR